MNLRLLPLASLSLVLAASGLSAQQERGVVTFGDSLDSLQLGGSARFRAENRNVTPPLNGSPADTLGTFRARVFLEAAFSERLNAKIEFQQVVADQGMPSDQNLRQAWVSWDRIVPGGKLQVGRFQMKFGNQRMVSPLDWSMIGRAWDGVLWHQGDDTWSGDFFWTQPVEGMSIATGTEQSFGGAYLHFDADVVTVDAYGFARRDRMVGGLGRNDQTLGALVEGRKDVPWTWSAEAATQLGSHGTEDAGGSAIALRTDFAVTDRFQVGVGYEVASGDNTPGDGNDDSFSSLFDFGHAYHGTQDIFGWSNLEDIVLRAAWNIDDNWVLQLDLHDFSMAETGGTIANGAMTAVAGQSDLGTEIDLAIKGMLHEGVQLWVGVSAFQAGDAIFNGDDQNWLFASLDLWL